MKDFLKEIVLITKMKRNLYVSTAVILFSSSSFATYRQSINQYGYQAGGCFGSNCSIHGSIHNQLIDDAKNSVETGHFTSELLIGFAGAKIQNKELSLEEYIDQLLVNEKQ